MTTNHDASGKYELTTPVSPLNRTLEKAPTHIPGLDGILEGGLPRGRTTVINGGSGSGKTLLGMEILYRGALAGEPGIFVGFEEPIEQIRENAATLGWDIAALEQENRLFLMGGHIKPDTLVSGDFSLKGLLASVSGKAGEIGAKRVVIDALEVMLRLFETPQQVRNEMHMLNDWLQASGLSVILTVRPPSRGRVSAYEDFFDSMGDCVIWMDARVVDQISTRRLRIAKYRGSGFGHNEYPYVITPTGLHAAPISTVGLRHKPLGGKITTGLVRLDSILDGGYRQGACILFAGIPGTGKTILAGTFTSAACDRGEKVLYIGFEESEDAQIENVSSAGVILKPHVDSGLLTFLTNYPEAMGAEEHYVQALSQINAVCPQHVIVDAISACERMGGKQAGFEYLMRMLNACKERGITIVMVNQLSGSTQFAEISGSGISSMVDTVIYLDYIKYSGETNRLLHILKSRGSAHSNQKREYVITDGGIQIKDVYLGDGDVLTGTARQVQEEKDRAAALQMDYEIQLKELELKQLQQTRKKLIGGIAERSAMRGAEGTVPTVSGRQER